MILEEKIGKAKRGHDNIKVCLVGSNSFFQVQYLKMFIKLAPSVCFAIEET